MDNINHFSYSMAKNIYRVSIIMALKLWRYRKTYKQSFLDLGALVHAHLLGGKQEFVVKQYFRIIDQKRRGATRKFTCR